MNYFEVKQRTDDQWYWNFVSSNGEVMATSGGQGYSRRRDAVRCIKDFVTKIGNGEFEVRLTER